MVIYCVLGVAKRTLTANDDANNIVDPGVYGITNGTRPQNSPVIYNGVIVVYRNLYSKIIQVAFDYNYNKCFFRTIDVSSSPTYKGWVEITTDLPSFYKNYADIAALTIGVQGFSYQSIRNEHTDLNNLPMHNVFTSVESTNSNVPTGLNFGHLLHFAYERNASQYVVQIIFQYNDDAIWFRSKWGDYWKPWKAVTITSV